MSLSGNTVAHLGTFLGSSETINLHDNANLEVKAGLSATGHLYDNSSAVIHSQSSETKVDISHDGNASLQVN